MRKVFALGGVAASIILIAFGIGSIVIGVSGRQEVQSNLSREYIVGSPDMTPTAIKAEAAQSKLATPAGGFPRCSVAGKSINSGTRAKCFASYMRIHTLEATGGYTYAQLGRYEAKPGAPKAQLAVGGGTDNATFAAVNAKTALPVANPMRDLWVTETALTTALNTSFFADRVAIFGIVMGVALLLTGIGFLVLTLGALYQPALSKRFRLVPRKAHTQASSPA